MVNQSTPARAASDRAPISGTAPLILLTLLFLGMIILGLVTDAVPIEDKALAFGPVFYSLTLMAGLVASFLGFSILEWVLRRRDHPPRSWARATMVILVAVVAFFGVACMLRVPMVALGVAANGLGVGTALLWSARGGRRGSRASWTLLWVSLVLAVVAAVWSAFAVRSVIG